MYRSAARIVVISDAFRENLLGKGVPPWKVAHIYNPYTRGAGEPRAHNGVDPARVLYMGNMGYSQNLPALVRAFETSSALGDEARLILAGTGELALEVAAEIRSTRVQMPGLLLDELEGEMQRATIGLVPQRPDVDEFNLPSKLMNLMSRGVPVLASVNPQSEIARIVQPVRRRLGGRCRRPGGVSERASRHPRRPGRARAAGRSGIGVRPSALQPGRGRDPV